MAIWIRARLAALALAVLCAAAPASALAALCDSCCCPPTPCHEAAGDCEELGAAACCEAAPAAAPAPAERSVEAPVVFAAVPARALANLAQPPASIVPRCDFVARVFAQRLSVVLRI